MTTRCLLAGLGLLLLPAVGHAKDCVNLVDAVDEISGALALVEIERAQQLADVAVGQLECQPQPVNTVVLAGLFQLVGAVAAFNGETADAEAAFARAVAVSPTTPIDPVYGEDVQALYQQVQRRVMEEPGGTLLLQGSAQAWLDGRKVLMGQPLDLLVGRHLLQWQVDEGSMQADEFRLASMETRQLTLGEATAGTQRRPARPVAPAGSGPNTALLIGGGAGVVLGGVLLGLAAGSQSAFFREEDPTALEGIQTRNHLFAISGVGLMVAGAGTAGASFFIHDGPGVRVGVVF